MSLIAFLLPASGIDSWLTLSCRPRSPAALFGQVLGSFSTPIAQNYKLDGGRRYAET